MKSKILVAGDSIAKGIMYDPDHKRYAHSHKGFCDLIAPYLSVPLKNAARFGQTIRPGFDRLRRDIAGLGPDIVLIEFGGNDCNYDWDEVAAAPDKDHIPATPVCEYERILNETILYCLEHGCTPVLMSLPPLDAERFLRWVGRDDPMRESILQWLGTVMHIYWWHEQYSSAIQQAALRHRVGYIDIRRAFLARGDFRDHLCIDGMHPNEQGHFLMARTCLSYIRDNAPDLLKQEKETARAIPMYPRLNCL